MNTSALRNNAKEATQKFSRAAIQVILFIAVMGTAMAVAAIMRMDFMPSFIISIGDMIMSMMFGMLGNLPIIFCMGLAAALAQKKKVDAAITALISFLFFLVANNTYLSNNNMLAEEGIAGLYGTGQAMVLGFQVVDMGVILGMLMGILVGWLHNKYQGLTFGAYFRIYEGSRFVFILMIPITAVMAISACYFWPPMNNMINNLASLIETSGVFGIFNYTAWNFWLIPTGLHHPLWMSFFYTPLGGTAEIGGEVIHGAQTIFLAEMSHMNEITELDPSIKYVSFGLTKVFGSLAIAAAFIRTAAREKKAYAKSIIIPSLAVAVGTGILEPLHFLYIFIAPSIWFIYGLVGGIADSITYMLGVSTYMPNGIIDLIITNIAMPLSLTKAHFTVLIGILMMPLWYFPAVWIIKKRNIDIFQDQDISNEDVIKSAVNDNSDVKHFITGLGGQNNIETVGNCFTRLRVQVKNPELINKSEIEKGKQTGVVVNGNNVQIIIGMHVETYKEKMCDALGLEA